MMKTTFPVFKFLCIAAALIIGLSVLFSYFSVSALGYSLSVNTMDSGDGLIILIVALAAIVCAFIDQYLPVLITGIVSLALFFLENERLLKGIRDLGSLARSLINNGPGYYCLLIGSAALIVFSVLGLVEKSRR